jgi:S-DNA-T family DNA segregation ATPase FtsK/SpoIIIE
LVVALLAGWLLVVWVIAKRPILSVPIVVYIGLVVWLGAHDAQALAVYALIALTTWRLVHKRSFQRLVGRRLRSSWRRLWVYDRRWRATMVLSGLGKRYGLRQRIPRIRSVQSEPWGDRVLIRLAVGQRTEDVERVAPALAHSFGARVCRVRENRPGRLWLLFAADDQLSAQYLASAIEFVDLAPLPGGGCRRRTTTRPPNSGSASASSVRDLRSTRRKHGR